MTGCQRRATHDLFAGLGRLFRTASDNQRPDWTVPCCRGSDRRCTSFEAPDRHDPDQQRHGKRLRRQPQEVPRIRRRKGADHRSGLALNNAAALFFRVLASSLV